MKIFTSLFKLLIVITLASFAFFAKGQNDYKMDIIGYPEWQKVNGVNAADTFWIEFNLYQIDPPANSDNYRRIRPALNPHEVEITLSEFRGNDELRPPVYIPGSLEMFSTPETGYIFPDSITVSLLIDRSGSILQHEMEQIHEAARAFVEAIPEGNVFISFFHNDITSTELITPDNFDEFDISQTWLDTDLYNAILAKLLEFDENAIWPNLHFEKDYRVNPEISRRKSQYNYLVVLTDGVNDIGNIPKYREPGIEKITRERLFDAIRKYRDRVKIFTLGFGGTQAKIDDALMDSISRLSGLHDGYFFAEPDSILHRFQIRLVESMAIDYRIQLANPPRKTYSGHAHNLHVKLNDEQHNMTVTGETNLQIGSTLNVITTGKEEDLMKELLWGIFTAFVIILVILIILQLIWPLIKNKIFTIKYVKKYKPASNEITRTCPLCFDPINEKDKVVAKCEHLVHHDCWKSNDHSCPEYPQNCVIGKQQYFDLNDPFSKKNKVHYLNWVLYGMFGGMLTWIIYHLVKDAIFFNQFAESMVGWVSESAAENKDRFAAKISPLLIIGVLMGFFLSLAFSYTEEFRRLSFLIFAKIILRGIIGGILGFITFFIGGLLTILAGFYTPVYWFDWIPWMLFGAAIGTALSYKTTIHWKHGLLGGVFSIVFAFFVLYILAEELQTLAVLICFMVYGAGLGVSIATVRSTAEQYFIKIMNGSKEGNMIAVHKWMSSQGGLNEVYLGRSNICEIQMNWEKGTDVGEKHAKMYVNKTRNMPVLVSLEKGKSTLYDNRLEMMLGKEYDLINGVTFKIGETTFQYIERDN